MCVGGAMLLNILMILIASRILDSEVECVGGAVESL